MTALIPQLSDRFPRFAASLVSYSVCLEHVQPPVSPAALKEVEGELGLQLPRSYVSFLECTRGVWLFGGAVQFGVQHPFFHAFPPLSELTAAQRAVVARRGAGWPPPSQGMLCFAEYFRDADGDQVLFDVSAGLHEGEYPVVYYSHEAPSVQLLSASFGEWLEHQCVDAIKPQPPIRTRP